MKKKLRLQIEKLRVEQFETHPDLPMARGTVHGLESPSGIGPSAPWKYCDIVDDTMWSCPATFCCEA